MTATRCAGVILTCMIAWSCGPATPAVNRPAEPTPRTPAQIAEQSKNSIVRIEDKMAVGTGFVVWKDGRIATNLHVIAAMQQPRITLPDGRVINHEQIEVMAVDRAHDLVVLRVPAKNMTPLTFGDLDQVRAGDRVVAIGHPLGLGNTVSDGLVSAVRVTNGVKLLQITAPIAPGSSGGPVMNDAGEVIAIATIVVKGGQNLNFAVPIDYLRPLLLQERTISFARFRQDITPPQLLPGCSPEEVEMAVTIISAAIKIGVPTYNSGDHQGCYDIYKNAAEILRARKNACPQVSKVLGIGLKNAARATKPSDKAWAVRRAFDVIFEIVNAAVGNR